MHIHRLSAAKIRNAKPGQLLNDGGGLMLQTTRGKDGRKNQSWLFRYALSEVIVSKHGRPRQRSRDMGLGPLATLSLHEAREKAKLLRQQRLEGIDPIEHRKARLAEKQQEIARIRTFDQCVHGYVSAHGVTWRSTKHATQWLGTLKRFASPVIGKLPVSKVDTPLVMKILEPIWTTKTETAHRVRGRIEAVLDYATAGGFRSGDNPASWAILEHLLAKPEKIKKTRHLDALSYVEIATFMAELRAVDSPAARALEFAILTGTRTAEVLGARWEEFGKDAETGLDVWTVPGNRTKSGRLHRVPLSDAALGVDRAPGASRAGKRK